MNVHFHGAAGEVTGSMHRVQTASGRQVLLDCGMIQGSREAEARNAEPFGFEAGDIDALVISHAHIDHIGRVPLLVQRGFGGPIFAQQATAELMPIMLLDAASLAESEAERANRRSQQRRDDPHRLHREAPAQSEFRPLFTKADVEAAMKLVQPMPYGQGFEVVDDVRVCFRDAGHILGSSIVDLWADGRKLVFSGDLGPRGTPILRDPERVREADLLLMESTYGNRNHRERAQTIRELGDILEKAWKDGGNVLIPAFAVGRSQELLYWFAKFREEWQMDRWQIFLDSPMASKVVKVYERHEELFDADAKAVWAARPSPFKLPNLRFCDRAEESQAINDIPGGAIVIAGSGMANGGRILHHLRHGLPDARHHVVFVGYQSEGTLGRRLVDGATWVRIHGRDIPVRAQRHTVGGLSAHTDQAGLLDWYGSFVPGTRVALVHGEDLAREALAGEIAQRHQVQALLTRPGLRVSV